MHLNDIKKLYFIGIGGIGMSALARYFNGLGVEIHGYDKTETPLTKNLVAEGMQVHYTDDPLHIPAGVDLVVYTPAVPADHLELKYFREKGYPVMKRAEVLGLISRGRKTVAIAGTDGKTTTSSLAAHVLRTGGVDCSAFLGGIAGNFGSNFVNGAGEWVVVEADEYDRSFLQLSPDLAVITSIDPDHLDIYGDRDGLLETGFRAFAGKLKPGGKIWVRSGLEGEFLGLHGVLTYGVESGEYMSSAVRVEDGFFVFDFEGPNGKMTGLRLSQPGRHNVENATSVIAIALELGISEGAIREALAGFKGVQRRFEVIFRSDKTVYVDDYAHHPAELEATISAARQLFPGRKLTGVFQPHLYTRTRDFADEFSAALDKLDETILLDIYPAREEPIEGVDAAMLMRKMKSAAKSLETRESLVGALAGKDLDIVLTMGAGNIDTLVKPIGAMLEQKQRNNEQPV
ncbi:MAG TPA: UDP-N-acetylmuramate--L-alanine ligase [Flavilitoribacter sp.]|nr:UDP-N-acetylmuramate--L-alanine ligase [Flavilitoribacter sp.]